VVPGLRRRRYRPAGPAESNAEASTVRVGGQGLVAAGAGWGL